MNDSGKNFRERVLDVVRRIPRGKVLTYGQVAILAGVPRAPRIVGGILFRLGAESRLPWQRVINASGGLSTYRVGSGPRQKTLLQKEGLRFNRQGKVDLKKHQWFPGGATLKALGVFGALPGVSPAMEANLSRGTRPVKRARRRLSIP